MHTYIHTYMCAHNYFCTRSLLYIYILTVGIFFSDSTITYRSSLHEVFSFPPEENLSGRSSVSSAVCRWLVIAVGLVRAYLARGSYHGLYYSIEKPLKFFQTGALLEVRKTFSSCRS